MQVQSKLRLERFSDETAQKSAMSMHLLRIVCVTLKFPAVVIHDALQQNVLIDVDPEIEALLVCVA